MKSHPSSRLMIFLSPIIVLGEKASRAQTGPGRGDTQKERDLPRATLGRSDGPRPRYGRGSAGHALRCLEEPSGRRNETCRHRCSRVGRCERSEVAPRFDEPRLLLSDCVCAGSQLTGVDYFIHTTNGARLYLRAGLLRLHRSYLTSHLSLKLVLNVQLFSRIWP